MGCGEADGIDIPSMEPSQFLPFNLDVSSDPGFGVEPVRSSFAVAAYLSMVDGFLLSLLRRGLSLVEMDDPDVSDGVCKLELLILSSRGI